MERKKSVTKWFLLIVYTKPNRIYGKFIIIALISELSKVANYKNNVKSQLQPS